MPEWKPEIVRRLAPLNLAPAREAEIAEELAQHLEDRYQELLASGKRDDQAFSTTIEELKGEDLLARSLKPVEKEAYREPFASGKPGRNVFAGVVQDIRYAFRMLRKSPGFTAVAILTLALGIGANTAIFSVINSVLLEPLPFKNPAQLVSLRETESAPGDFPLDGADYLDWQAQNRTLSLTSLYTQAFFASAASYSTSGEDVPEAVAAISTQANFFETLDIQPLIGRTFAKGEDAAGKDHEVVLSYGFWQRHFAGSPAALG